MRATCSRKAAEVEESIERETRRFALTVARESGGKRARARDQPMARLPEAPTVTSPFHHRFITVTPPGSANPGCVRWGHRNL